VVVVAAKHDEVQSIAKQQQQYKRQELAYLDNQTAPDKFAPQYPPTRQQSQVSKEQRRAGSSKEDRQESIVWFPPAPRTLSDTHLCTMQNVREQKGVHKTY